MGFRGGDAGHVELNCLKSNRIVWRQTDSAARALPRRFAACSRVSQGARRAPADIAVARYRGLDRGGAGAARMN